MRRLEGVRKMLSRLIMPGLLKLKRKLKRQSEEVLLQEDTLGMQKSRIQ